MAQRISKLLSIHACSQRPVGRNPKPTGWHPQARKQEHEAFALTKPIDKPAIPHVRVVIEAHTISCTQQHNNTLQLPPQYTLSVQATWPGVHA